MAEARLLVGIGAGNMALCNAYVSQATSLKERTSAVANLAATGVCVPHGFCALNNGLPGSRVQLWAHDWHCIRRCQARIHTV
jgi:hypothetical protein